MDVRFLEADRRQHFVEELSGAAYKRFAFEVLVATRRLSDDHEARVGGAAVEAEVLGGGLEPAAVEPGEGGLEVVERRRISGDGTGGQLGGVGRGGREAWPRVYTRRLNPDPARRRRVAYSTWGRGGWPNS